MERANEARWPSMRFADPPRRYGLLVVLCAAVSGCASVSAPTPPAAPTAAAAAPSAAKVAKKETPSDVSPAEQKAFDSALDALSSGHMNEAQRGFQARSEEHTSELQSPDHLVCRLLLEKKKESRVAHLYRGLESLMLFINDIECALL